MRAALIYASRSATLYPLPLLKIGAMLKSQGHEVELFINRLPRGQFDEAWVSTCFTYDIPAAIALIRRLKPLVARIRVGGIAATLLPEVFEHLGDLEIHRGLLPEAEDVVPDYSLLGHEPEYSIAYTTRGCVRHCSFCMVPQLEDRFTHEPHWHQRLHARAQRVLFYDNNWLAKPIDGWLEDVAHLRRLTRSGRITSFDFNQGIDCRLMAEERAAALEGLPLNPIRFAFDGKQEDGHYQKAVRLMIAHGFTQGYFMTYVLWNFTDTPEDVYYRIKVSAELTAEFGFQIASFPMRYQPIFSIDPKRGYVGKHWTPLTRRNFSMMVHGLSTHGELSFNPRGDRLPTAVAEMEYYFGRDEQEFVRMLNYPKLRELFHRRRASMAYLRAQDRIREDQEQEQEEEVVNTYT